MEIPQVHADSCLPLYLYTYRHACAHGCLATYIHSWEPIHAWCSQSDRHSSSFVHINKFHIYGISIALKPRILETWISKISKIMYVCRQTYTGLHVSIYVYMYLCIYSWAHSLLAFLMPTIAYRMTCSLCIHLYVDCHTCWRFCHSKFNFVQVCMHVTYAYTYIYESFKLLVCIWHWYLFHINAHNYKCLYQRLTLMC